MYDNVPLLFFDLTHFRGYVEILQKFSFAFGRFQDIKLSF